MVASDMKAKASSRPSASTTVPARVETPMSVPVLARTNPAAGRVSGSTKRSAKVPVSPAMGRPSTTGQVHAGADAPEVRLTALARVSGDAMSS